MGTSAFYYRTPLGRAIRAPLRLLPLTLPLSVLRGPLRGTWWLVGAGQHGCWLGSYEKDKQYLFARTVQPGWTVFDVGAHAGFYTLLASRLVGRTGRVVALEPWRPNVRLLATHLHLNRRRNVLVLPVAAADQAGTASFAPGFNSVSGALCPTGSVRVPATTLDAVAARVGMPDCVKIDAEGAELAVLRGATRVLTEGRPVVFLATHTRAIGHQCLALLRSHGYRVEPVTPGLPAAIEDEYIAVTER